MDIQLQTKISVLLEKIYYLQQSIQQNGNVVSKVDKDLLVNYVRELYELTLTLPVAAPPMYPPQNYPYPNQNTEYQQPYQQPQYPQNPVPQPAVPQPNYPPNPPAPQPYSPPPAYIQPDNPFLQNEGFLNPAAIVPNGSNGSTNGSSNGNGSYVNGNNGNGSNGKENGSNGNGQHLNAAFTFSNGKRSLSESIKIKTANDKPSLNEQFKKQEPEFAGKIHKSPIKDLKTYIGLNKRFSYINYLFGNDAGLYDEAIEKINSCKDIVEAKKYIHNHLIPKLSWDDRNEMVGEFNNLVERRFAQ